MIVNFASGNHPFPAPWWNVDLNDHPGVDERIDLLDEFPPTLIDVHLAYVGHFLEHLQPGECGTFLARLRAVMSPGSRVVVVGPDVTKAEDQFRAGLLCSDLLAAIRPHGERDGHDVSHIHAWLCTADRVRYLLEKAGFSGPVDIDWDQVAGFGIPIISDAAWQCAVTAVAA